jgi:hypothetical protein
VALAKLVTLLREGRKSDAWLKYCGFIDLSLGDFMGVQERLLAEQLELLAACPLGRRLLGAQAPPKVADFRRAVPLTRYEDYLPYLEEKREDVLPARPRCWVCTSGKAGEYERKWAPYPPAWFETHTKNFLAAVIFSLTNSKGDFWLRENAHFLYAMAPPPYLTGMVPYGLKDEFPFEYLPPSAQAERMSFEEQNAAGFRLGLGRGIDLFFGLSSVLVRIGERFEGGEGLAGSSRRLGAAAGLRLARGLLRSRLRKRPTLPRDVWTLKGIICAGTDTTFYKERIAHYWGRKPLEIYGGTEIGIAATQTWDYEGMVLFPDANFWEFIPEEEHVRSLADPGYEPATVLLPDLEPGRRYELVVTNLRGGVFVRYRVGDMIKALSRRNERLGIDLPQIVYEDRVEDFLDLASFTRITERTVWEALRQAGVAQGNWLAHKVYAGNHPVVELYLELPGEVPAPEISARIHTALRAVDSDFRDLEDMLGYHALRVVPLPVGNLSRVREKEAHASRLHPPAAVLEQIAAAQENGRAREV